VKQPVNPQELQWPEIFIVKAAGLFLISMQMIAESLPVAASARARPGF
jgi:hypothetical protein